MLSRARTSLPIHPTLTFPDGSPVRALGVSPRTGRLIWPVHGGAPDGGDGGGTGGTGGDGAQGAGGQGGDGGQAAGSGQGAQQTAGQQGQQGQQAPDTAGQPGKVEDLPAWAQKIITDTRAEAAQHRTGKTAAEQKQAELLENIGKALGLNKDEPADPAKLQQTVAERDAQLKAQTVELAAWQAADRAGAKAAALLDSRSFVTAVSKLDPTAEDFTTQLDAAVAKAVADNPLLKAGQAPARGGSEFPGGPGGENKPTSLQDAIAARLSAGG